MDGLATMTAIRTMFAAPLHVWVPKLLKSRDDWKQKALHRRQQVKITKLTVRDLTRSRDTWRDQAHQLQRQLQQQAEQLELLHRERDQAIADDDAPKKSDPPPIPRPAAASIRSRSYRVALIRYHPGRPREHLAPAKGRGRQRSWRVRGLPLGFLGKRREKTPHPATALPTSPRRDGPACRAGSAAGPNRGEVGRHPPRRWLRIHEIWYHRLSVQLVLDAGCSMRGCAAVLTTLAARQLFAFAVPAFSTIRAWILRLGHAERTRPLDRAQRWFWRIDHAIPVGDQKLLVILGGSLDRVAIDPRPLARSDLQLIALVPMTHSTGDAVERALEVAALRTGRPRRIVSNQGCDLVKGIRDYADLRPDFDLGGPPGSSAPDATERASYRSLRPFARLPGADAEGRQVATALGATPYLAAEAVKYVLLQAKSPAVLHLATHGFALPERPTADAVGGRWGQLLATPPRNPLLRAGLAFAGANTWLAGGHSSARAGTGLLTAEEVAGLDLSATRLVVLSACDTGLGEVIGGEGVCGFRRAFALAGAAALVASLWPVPDTETRELMTAFYGGLRAGVPAHVALRRAMLAVRTRDPDPVSWAGFLFQGDPSEVRW